jgi:hypothetical protein
MEDFVGLPDDYHRPRRTGLGGIKRGLAAAAIVGAIGGLAWLILTI